MKGKALKEFFCHLFLPQSPLIFILILLGLSKKGHLGQRKDGSAGFCGAMEKRYKDLSGKITYGARIERILVENKRAVGVRLESGEVRADYVVSAGDGYSTLFKLLEGKYADRKLKHLYDRWPLFAPVMVLNFGLDYPMEGTPSFLTIRPKSPVTSGHLKDRWWLLRIFNYGKGYAPQGKSLVQVMIDSAWELLTSLYANKDAYKKEKHQLAEEVGNALTEIWPGFNQKIEMCDVATPITLERYTLNRHGAFEGFAITGDTFKTEVNRTLKGLDRFVMAGQWTIPGGGLFPSLMTGRHGAMILCHFEKKRFVTEFG